MEVFGTFLQNLKTSKQCKKKYAVNFGLILRK